MLKTKHSLINKHRELKSYSDLQNTLNDRVRNKKTIANYSIGYFNTMNDLGTKNYSKITMFAFVEIFDGVSCVLCEVLGEMKWVNTRNDNLFLSGSCAEKGKRLRYAIERQQLGLTNNFDSYMFVNKIK